MTSSSPWNTLPTNEASCLSDIMSEQLAVKLSDLSEIREERLAEIKEPVESDDLAIARLLQEEFDREHNEAIHREEKAMNGSSKVRVSLNNYRTRFSDEEYGSSCSSSEGEDEDWEGDSLSLFEPETFPPCGYKRMENGEILTKHDAQVSYSANGRKVLESFPPGISTGEDVRVSNAVFNEIKRFSLKDGRRRASRLKDKEDKATEGQHTDTKTRLILYKMVNAGVLEVVRGIVSTGKEAVILHAEGAAENEEVPKDVAIKIYKTTLNEFKNREKYIRDDYRFRDRFSKQNPRKIVHLWAEKEMHNLGRMAKAGIRVPEVILLKKHVLVMSFIGNDGRPAPKLRDAVLSSNDWKRAYEEVVSSMKTLYSVCHLVHGDLSEYNILWHDKTTWFIDVSQAVEPTHPHALEFLYRDATNVTDFFSTRISPDDGVLKTEEELFSEISDLYLDPERDIDDQLISYQEQSGGAEDFDADWARSENGPISIPGGGKLGSACGRQGGKSPKTGSVGSVKSLASMTEGELRDFKESVIASPHSPPPTPRSQSKVSFTQ